MSDQGSVGVPPASSSSKKSGQDGHAPLSTAVSEASQFLIYQSENGSITLDVRLDGRTVWLSQKQIAELFAKAKGSINKHLKNIFDDGELTENSVVRLYQITAADGKTYGVAHCNLDMVLAKYGEGFCKPFRTTPAHNPRSFAKGFQNPSPYCHRPPREKS